jgi:hypothetical protein
LRLEVLVIEGDELDGNGRIPIGAADARVACAADIHIGRARQRLKVMVPTVLEEPTSPTGPKSGSGPVALVAPTAARNSALSSKVCSVAWAEAHGIRMAPMANIIRLWGFMGGPKV